MRDQNYRLNRQARGPETISAWLIETDWREMPAWRRRGLRPDDEGATMSTRGKILNGGR